MKTLQQEREHGSTSNAQFTALQEDKRIALSTSLPTSENNFNQDESFRPYTTLVIAVITNAAQIQQQTSSPDPSPFSLPQLSSNASITSVATSTSSSPTLSASSKHWHITQIGTVVSESETPKAWAPKFLDVEKVQLNVFLGCVALLFIVTIIGIIGTGMVRQRVRSRGRWI
jgi:hypothetical protein